MIKSIPSSSLQASVTFADQRFCTCDVLLQVMVVSLKEMRLYVEFGVFLLAWLCVSRYFTPSVDSVFLFDCVLVVFWFTLLKSVSWNFFFIQSLFHIIFWPPHFPVTLKLWFSFRFWFQSPLLVYHFGRISGKLWGVLFPQPPFQNPKVPFFQASLAAAVMSRVQRLSKLWFSL